MSKTEPDRLRAREWAMIIFILSLILSAFLVSEIKRRRLEVYTKHISTPSTTAPQVSLENDPS